jgi:hypothetical protein
LLGSGKTTTLARVLMAPEFAGTVGIINDFGEIEVDHLQIETSGERVALLDNGCVRCSVRDDLVDTLQRSPLAISPSSASSSGQRGTRHNEGPGARLRRRDFRHVV